MNLLVQQLKTSIAALARARGLAGARVLEKVNKYGEIVIALILPANEQPPPPPETANEQQDR